MNKTSASYHMSDHLKGRSGRRPVRVATILKNEKKKLEVPFNQEKLSSSSGADLRMPLMGGTKFPTKDSTAPIEQQLKSTQNVAEFHKPQGTTLKDVIPNIKAPATMPKIGADMTIQNDPLVKHLKKCAEVLEDNKDDMPMGPEQHSRTREEVIPDIKSTEGQWQAYINGLFDNGESTRKKDTSYDYEEGVVDRILKL